jgi:hypothetical protein
MDDQDRFRMHFEQLQETTNRHFEVVQKRIIRAEEHISALEVVQQRIRTRTARDLERMAIVNSWQWAVHAVHFLILIIILPSIMPSDLIEYFKGLQVLLGPMLAFIGMASGGLAILSGLKKKELEDDNNQN